MRAFVCSAVIVIVAACGNGGSSAPAVEQNVPFEPSAFSVAVNGSGRPVILIPGLGCDGNVWAETVAHLAGYQTHVLTLAGFAGQPPIDGPLSATVRDELSKYIVDRKLDHPIVIGHSMGGFIAYWLASTAPDLVGPVIVVDSGASLGTGDPAADAETGGKLRAMWAGASDDAFAQQAHDAFGSMVTDPAKLAAILVGVGRSDRKTIGDAVYELFTTDLRAGLSQIRAPVLLVLADGSLQDGLRAQAGKIPDHQVVVIAHARHFVFVDDPPAFFTAIDAFLAAHPAVKADVKAPATAATALPS
jgi:N-formylmaleamate deformylase